MGDYDCQLFDDARKKWKIAGVRTRTVHVVHLLKMTEGDRRIVKSDVPKNRKKPLQIITEFRQAAFDVPL